MKAVILARVLTKEQEDGHSLEAQTRNLELYAQRKALQIVKVFTVIESSTKGERPEFMRMIDFIKGQKEKVALIVDTVDRLQRSFKETPILNELLEKDVLELLHTMMNTSYTHGMSVREGAVAKHGLSKYGLKKLTGLDSADIQTRVNEAASNAPYIAKEYPEVITAVRELPERLPE